LLIVQKLKHIPKEALQQVLDFVAFLEWRRESDAFGGLRLRKELLSVKSEDLRQEDDAQWLETDLSNLDSYEAYDWQPGELNEGLSVKYYPQKGLHCPKLYRFAVINASEHPTFLNQYPGRVSLYKRSLRWRSVS
jgi:hypothetical protein